MGLFVSTMGTGRCVNIVFGCRKLCSEKGLEVGLENIIVWGSQGDYHTD